MSSAITINGSMASGELTDNRWRALDVLRVAAVVLMVQGHVFTGGFFEAGEPLLRLERVDYEAALETARAELAKAESEERRARKELDRQRELANRSVASEARIDDAENAWRVASAELRAASARQLRAERDLERTEITGPYDGRVRTESVDVGQFVARGQAVAHVYAVDYAEVRLPVPDRDLRFLDLPYATGDEAGLARAPVVKLRAEFAGVHHTWTGRVVRTEGVMDPKSRMIHLVARVDDPFARRSTEPTPPLAVGMFVHAEIEGRVAADTFVVPRAALREDGRLVVVTRDSRLEFREVEILRTERTQVVVGRGLSDGESVLATPLSGAVDGMSVRVARDQAGHARGGSLPAGRRQSR